MKRNVMISGVVVAVLVIGMALAATSLAQGPVDDGDGVRTPVGGAYGPAHGFVDTDGDGINDCYLTGECGASGVGTGMGNAYRFAQGRQGQTSSNGTATQNRLQQQDCEGDCTQDGTGDQVQTRVQKQDCEGDCTQEGTGDQVQTRVQQQDCDGDCTQESTGEEVQTRSRDSSAAGQSGVVAGSSTGSGQRGQRAH